MANQTHRNETQQWQVQNQGQDKLHNIKNFLDNKSPSTPQTIAILTILPFPAAAFLLFLGGLALTGSVIGPAVSTPLFILFSPIIVPAMFTIAFAAMGFLASGAFGLMGISAVSWIVTRRALESVGEKVTGVGYGLSNKASDSTGYSAHGTADLAEER